VTNGSSQETLRTWRLKSLSRDLDESEESLRRRACREAGVDFSSLRGFRVVRQALDARRRRGGIRLVCHVDMIVADGPRSDAMAKAIQRRKITETAPPVDLDLRLSEERRRKRVVVVGTGPGGVFAAWVLARNGVDVTLIDRGEPVERRSRKLVAFHRRREHDADSNLLFGEGGAGTYSDGKLYTRVDHVYEVPILEELVACGAPEDLVYDARAHIGTDRLHRVLPTLRRRLEERGAKFAWQTKMTGMVFEEGPPKRVTAVRTDQGELPCDAVVLSVGHSARDTWDLLSQLGFLFEAKPFQLGVRVEHPQALITRGQYGDGPEARTLGAASYNLVSKARDGVPSAHSFCMCPGGRIVASVSEAGLLCTNGMSNSRHSTPYANAAIVTTFGPEEYAQYGEGPFAGVAFQRGFERVFFERGGGDYTAPAQRAEDFVAGRLSSGELKASYIFGTRPERIDELIPEKARAAIARGLDRFDQIIPGYLGEGLLVGLESRSSGPVRMTRSRETRLAEGFANVYPVGEGAGYAGGIMSAALDGAESAKVWCLA